MNARQIMDSLFALAADVDFSGTCDTCKAGDPNREVAKVAVTMFPTVRVIREAAQWGAQLLIVHEPLYYNDRDIHSDEAQETAKRALIEETGMTVWRFHDHAHLAVPDLITEGVLKALDLPGKTECDGPFDFSRMILETAMTPLALAKRVEDKLHIAHVRVCGAANTPCTRLSCLFGAPGGLMEEIVQDRCEILMAGEVCEWMVAEYVRDAALLGRKKALLILGHAGSERDGMAYTASLLRDRFPGLAVRYLDCGEVYTYTDNTAESRG